jgi:hypothetical protein
MKFQEKLNKINPTKLFLIDSLGGLLSAFMLGFVLVKFENSVGMSRSILYFLSGIALVFSVYSFVCFLWGIKNWQIYLKIIAIANLLYCCLTVILMIYGYEKLTVLGLIYFVLEIMIVVILAIIELKMVAISLKKLIKIYL